MGVESLKHLFAKNALAQWLTEATDDHDFYELSPLRWRPNRGNAGIWIEYPVCIDSENNLVGLDPVWDENGFFRRARALINKNDLEDWDDGQESYVPTYDECIANSLLPICIFDVAIQSKGFITTGIEVVHRNPVSQLKKKYLQRINNESGCGIDVYQINADWILNQVNRPSKLNMTKIMDGFAWYR